MSTTAADPRVGGGFLVGPTDPASVLTPERLGPERREVRRAIGAFVAAEVTPRRERVEAGEVAVHRELLERLGRDGYVAVEVPAEYGGAGLDQATAAVVADAVAPADGFAATLDAHAGIGTLPVLYFGTEDQRRRWLPGLVAGTTVGAYALTEPGSGSDARALRTRAERRPGGGYRLTGSKQFITNAGFADLFTLYARVEDAGLAAFLVPRETPGLSVGPEEDKLGMRGSSTCPLALDGVELPADALLGEAGQGHRIAFNVLNVGRLRLAAAVLGSMRVALAAAVAYAGERVAFGRPIAGFALVAAKLAGMAARVYAVESVVYRLCGQIDARLPGVDSPIAALEEYAVECSIAKVLAGEELGWCADELVQVHGGYGYVEDHPAARLYRDARIHRIWEGTSEINRLLVPTTLARRAAAGRLALDGPIDGAGGDPLEALRVLARGLLVAALDRFGEAVEEEQEVLAGLADLALSLLAAESASLRAQAAGPADGAHADLAALVVADHAARVCDRALEVAPRIGGGCSERVAGALHTLGAEAGTRIARGRAVAGRVSAAGGYPV